MNNNETKPKFKVGDVVNIKDISNPNEKFIVRDSLRLMGSYGRIQYVYNISIMGVATNTNLLVEEDILTFKFHDNNQEYLLNESSHSNTHMILNGPKFKEGDVLEITDGWKIGEVVTVKEVHPPMWRYHCISKHGNDYCMDEAILRNYGENK